jgi:hypothetical protein
VGEAESLGIPPDAGGLVPGLLREDDNAQAHEIDATEESVGAERRWPTIIDHARCGG